MKVFHSQKYQFFDIVVCEGRPYYAFKCIKENFDPEVVLVRQARYEISSSIRVYFDEADLDRASKSKQLKRLCVNRSNECAKLIDLLGNESKLHASAVSNW